MSDESSADVSTWHQMVDEWVAGRHSDIIHLERVFGGSHAVADWWREAYAHAQQNAHEPRWQLVIGTCHYTNRCGADWNYELGAQWLQRAADHGLAHAQWMLGLCHANGHGVRLNQPRAHELFPAAAEQGHADSRHGEHVAVGNKAPRRVSVPLGNSM